MVNPLLVLGGAAAAAATAAYFLLAPDEERLQEDRPITTREQRTAVIQSPSPKHSIGMLNRMKRKEGDPGYTLVIPGHADRPPASPGFAWTRQPGRYEYWEYARKPSMPSHQPGTVPELPSF